MNNRRSRYRLFGVFAVAAFVVTALSLPFSSRAADKLKPEEIVAKNLESIGTAEARAKITNRIVGGSVTATFTEPQVNQFQGQAVLASEGEMSLINMQFANSNYPQETLSFNGKTVSVGFARAGVRTNLGDLIWTYKPLIKAGIMGGELSQSWPLYDLAGRKPKLSGGGTKKVGSKDAYEISLVPRGGSDMEIKVYFDTQTFQHVRTEYSLVVRPSVGLTVDSNKSQQPSRYKLVEEFGDFKKEGDLTLPHTYKITLEIDRAGNDRPATVGVRAAAALTSFRGNWAMTLDQFGFNQAIPPETFSPPSAQ